MIVRANNIRITHIELILGKPAKQRRGNRIFRSRPATRQLAIARFGKGKGGLRRPTFCLAFNRTSGLEIDRRFLAAFLLDFIADLLTFLEALQPGALDGANMDEDVLASVIGLNGKRRSISRPEVRSDTRQKTGRRWPPCPCQKCSNVKLPRGATRTEGAAAPHALLAQDQVNMGEPFVGCPDGRKDQRVIDQCAPLM